MKIFQTISSIIALALLASTFQVVAFGQSLGSAGAKVGWAYYGLLLPARASDTTEQWQDLNFALTDVAAGSKKPVQNAHAKALVAMNIRTDAITVSQNGAIQWPSVNGVLGADSLVTILEIKQFPSSQGVHYWTKIQR
jgi:hypothetical protein